MKIFFLLLLATIFLPILADSQTEAIKVDRFNKIIISPHIEANLIAGEVESVAIKTSQISRDKINIKVQGKTLRIYLDDAKVITKSQKMHDDNWSRRHSIYEGTMVTIDITYKDLVALSVRGEEDIVCLSPIHQEEFQLKIYGEPAVLMKNLQLEDLNVTIYGEGQLNMEGGTVRQQSFVAYGESKVKASKIENASTRIRAYGEGDFRVNVSDYLRVSAFGEAQITYLGTPSVEKGLIIGEATIRKDQLSL